MVKKIYIAHGAICNAGDYLIFNRGWSLLKKYIGAEDVELIPIKRWEMITGHCDALIILGGPIISRRMHSQSINIKNYLDKNKVPVICLGIGISGEDYSTSESYFIDQESLNFWTELYNSSKLFSVRDAYTHNVLRANNIPAVLTGCPALFDLDYIGGYDESAYLRENKNHNLTISIPNIDSKVIPYTIKTLFLITYVKIKNGDVGPFNRIRVVFQHGAYSWISSAVAKIIKLCGFEVIDGSGMGIDEIHEIDDSDVHIGTRLHMNIYFLSKNKQSYLLSVDNRTNAFLETIPTSSSEFTIMGIKSLVDESYESLTNEKIQYNDIDIWDHILDLYSEMECFLRKLNHFVRSKVLDG